MELVGSRLLKPGLSGLLTIETYKVNASAARY